MRLEPAWLLAGLLLAAGVALYLVEWVEVTEDVGFSAEALRDPYLAARRFLSAVDVDVRRSEGLTALETLPPAGEALLLGSARRSLSDARAQRLLDWVRHGGRLILVATELSDGASGLSGDALLDTLQVAVYEDEEARATGLPMANDDRLTNRLSALLGADGCSAAGGLTLVDGADEPQPLLVAMHPSRYLVYSGDGTAYAASSIIGAQLLLLELGRGEVAVLTTLSQWRNGRIGCADHAHLLRWLVDDQARLWWLANTEMANLLVLLWQRYALAMVIGAALLALWGWRQAFRLTRPDGSAPPIRRSLLEHVDGITRFRWQQGDAQALLASLRQEVRTVHAIDDATVPLVGELAGRLGVSRSSLGKALFADPGRDAGDFVEAVQLLQRLRHLA